MTIIEKLNKSMEVIGMVPQAMDNQKIALLVYYSSSFQINKTDLL